eukprot:TRINITY_DN16699_c0_g2_i3.p1 TRINITY_DN16699_c0_g2~~TRINITY_DN16699_c0_g2_i3.p1  ORF type:complete len:272 (-),score=83.30 TRINITY_DN16699_c0_g2_i3:559-1374(-)
MAFASNLLRLTGILLSLSSVEGTVLVTGAAGRTGSLLYKALKKEGKLGPVRALVRNATKAKERLGCSKCDESEGIFVGDIEKPETLVSAFADVKNLAIVTGVYGMGDTAAAVKGVEWLGVQNQVAALLKGGADGKRIVLMSTMGTTSPPPAKIKSPDDEVGFYKLNAEAFVASAGVPFAIVKPCGLNEKPAGQCEIMVGHDDEETWFDQGFYMISREDVANVMAAALTDPPGNSLRFDICAKKPGSGPPAAASNILKQALYPWEQSSEVFA